MEKFDFIFLIIFQTKLLEIVNFVSNLKKSKYMVLDKTKMLLNEALKTLISMRQLY